MYHEITYEGLRLRKRRAMRAAAVAALVCALAATALLGTQALTREQGAETLRASIIEAALQCCAVEGSYPVSIEHLERHYGLVANTTDYQVTYEWLGDNVAPAVVVRPR